MAFKINYFLKNHFLKKMSSIAYGYGPRCGVSSTSRRATFNYTYRRGYYIPYFSHNWSDYIHAPGTNETIVVSDGIGGTSSKSYTVWSAAQLELLFQASFVMKLRENAEPTKFEYDDRKYKIEVPNYELLMSNFPSYYQLKSSELADIANLSGFWREGDDTCTIIPLYEVFPEGSYTIDAATGEEKVNDDIPIDDKLVKISALCYGMPPEKVDGITKMSQIGDWMKERGLIPDDYEVTNARFPPLTLNSPIYFQVPISAFKTRSSVLRGLSGLTDKVIIKSVVMWLCNTSGDTFNCKVKGGLFNSPTTDYISQLNILNDNGTQGIHQVGPGQSFRVVTEQEKTVKTTTAGGNLFPLQPAASSFGYQAVVQVYLDYTNFFNNAKTNQIQHLTLEAFEVEINISVEADVQIPVLNALNMKDNMVLQLTDTVLEQQKEIEYLESQIQPTPPGPTPTPTTGSADPGRVWIEGVQYINVDGSWKPVEGNLDKNLISRLADKRSKKLCSGIGEYKDGDLRLYNQLDQTTLALLSEPSIYPLQQFLSWDSMKVETGKSKAFVIGTAASLDTEGGAGSIEERPEALPLQSFSVPYCGLHGNCYTRGGICQRKKLANDTAMLTKITQTADFPANSEIHTALFVGEMLQTIPLQGNATNVANICAQGEEGESLIEAESIATDVNPPEGLSEKPEGFIEPEQQGKNNILGALKVGCQILGTLGGALPTKGKKANGTTLINLLAKNRVMASMSSLQPKQKIYKQEVEPVDGNAEPELQTFLAGQLSVDENFVGLDGIKENNLEAWDPEDQEFIQNQHQELLEFKYMVPMGGDKSGVTPCLMSINKSAIANYGVALATVSNTAGVPSDFRSNGLPNDSFTNMMSSRCIVVLSTIPYGSEGFYDTAVICSGLGDFVKVPNPSTKSQPSAENGSACGEFYGSFRHEDENYYIFNNTFFTEINDLSGSAMYYIPSQVPVKTEGGEVQLTNTLDYYKAGGVLYGSVYCMTSFDITVKLGSSIKYLPNATQGKLAMALWGMKTEDGQSGVIKEYQMPVITSLNNGKVVVCGRAITTGELPMAQGFFYGATDRFQLGNTGVRTTIEAPEENKRKRTRKVAKKTKKDLTGREVARVLSQHLSAGTRVTFMGGK